MHAMLYRMTAARAERGRNLHLWRSSMPVSCVCSFRQLHTESLREEDMINGVDHTFGQPSVEDVHGGALRGD